jgi:hypothetical protein
MALSTRAVVAGAIFLLAGTAHSGGPLVVDGDGEAIVWSTTSPIAYRTDNGPLSPTVSESAARSRVASMFNVWQSVPSSSISYTRAGSISSGGGFNDGDVSTVAEYDAVTASCNSGSQSPIIYDANGTIFDDLGFDPGVIGFAGPCASNAAGRIVSGRAVMNGRFQDGIDSGDNFELSPAEFDAAFVHEFGHFSGLAHSQVNRGCVAGACPNADDLAGLPTMFPFLIDASQGQLGVDDVAWVSMLYPQTTGGTTFPGTHGVITGVVFFSDGESHVQNVNVVARQVDTGANEDRRIAASCVSGYKFAYFHGNPINDAGDDVGSHSASHIGYYEIPVPPGNYTVEVEYILLQFVDGSSVGGPIRFPFPGVAPAPIGPISVAAGETARGNHVTILGTEPRFDQFEGP